MSACKGLQSRPGIKALVCVTGQHRMMLDQVLETFNVIPDYDISIMKDKQDLFDITVAVLNGIKPVLEEAKPDIVLVYGDTSTTFAAALAAFRRKLSVLGNRFLSCAIRQNGRKG